jgi:hypothetical protein
MTSELPRDTLRQISSFNSLAVRGAALDSVDRKRYRERERIDINITRVNAREFLKRIKIPSAFWFRSSIVVIGFLRHSRGDENSDGIA